MSGVEATDVAHVLLVVLPFLLALVMRRESQPYTTRLLDAFLFIGVGVQGVLVGLQQVTRGEEVAEYVDWVFSPFVAELGIMNLAFGVLGLVAPFARRDWKLATAVGYGFFLGWSAVIHISDAVGGNLSSGNVGPALWSRMFICLALLVLVIETRERPASTPSPAD